MEFPIAFLIAFYIASIPFHALGAAGDVEPGFNPNFGPVSSNTVYTVIPQPDGKLLVGGSFFEFMDGQFTVQKPKVTRLLADGHADYGFSSGFDFVQSDYVLNSALQGDGKVVVVGNFTQIGGVTRNRIARMLSNGTLDPGFNPDANDTPTGMAVQSDGAIILCGNFTTLNGITRNWIARFSLDGTLDPNFNPITDSTVLCANIQSDGRIIVAGNFSVMNGVARSRMARLYSDGTLDTTFTPSTINGGVGVSALQADGKVIIGGSFSNVGGLVRNRIARLNANGTVDGTFQPVLGGLGPSVSCATLQTDGRMIIGGGFRSVNGVTRNYIARLNGDGTLDTGFNPNPNDLVTNAAVQADGKVVIGGLFSTVAGTTHKNAARLDNNPTVQSLMVPSAGRIQWLRSGASPETQQVAFELSTNGGANWIALGSATRIVGGWELAGLSLPAGGSVRARARTTGGRYSGSSGIVETSAAYTAAPTPFQQWMFSSLGPNAPETGDADGDGFNNLAEYALTLSPSAPDPSVPIDRHLYAEGERLRVFFTRDPARNDVTIEVQAASDIAGTWTTIATSALGDVTNGPGYVGGDNEGPGLKTIEVRDSINIAEAPQRFLRFRITHF